MAQFDKWRNFAVDRAKLVESARVLIRKVAKKHESSTGPFFARALEMQQAKVLRSWFESSAVPRKIEL